MVRKLALAVSLAVGSLPLSVYGLGLGEIESRSVLNENFSADIALLSVAEGELGSIKVRLGSTEAFARAGVERMFMLSSMRFDPVRLDNGKAVIRVTTSEPVREPFLDFLVEVNWPKGRMIKEYTVLLDPPATTHRRPVPVSQATTTSGSQRASTRSGMAATAEGEYGPVASNETLWSIAENLKPQGVSIHQMMEALQAANPGAFINGNMNLLKRGSILRVPSSAEIEGMSEAEALVSFQRQQEAWRSASQASGEATDMAEGMAGATAADTAEEEAARLKIAAARSEETGTAGSGEMTEVPTSTGELTEQLLLAREDRETARQEADELRGQVGGLEERLEDMDRLLKLKDEQLARLQAAVSGEGAEAVTEGMEGETTISESTGTGTEVTEETEATEETETTEEQIMATEEAVAEVEETPVAAPMEPAAKSAPVKPKPKAVAQQPVVPPQSWLEENMTLLGLGLLGLLGIGALIGFMGRRRGDEAAADDFHDESILLDNNAFVDEVDDAASASRSEPDSQSLPHDTSFLSEYSTEELKALQEDTSDVDPVSEADVYIAYGRYKQAEEILQQALDEEPGRAVIAYKMLEVYFATQNKSAFTKLATEMVEAGQDREDPDAWEHIKTMGRDLDNSNPLFAGESGAGEAAVATPFGMTSSAEPETEMSLDLSTLADELDSTLSDEDSQPFEGLESLDLEMGGIEAGEESAFQDQQPEDDTENLAVDSLLSETELHTQMADISELGELEGDGSALEDDLMDLEGDLDGLMEDSINIDESLDFDQDIQDSLIGDASGLLEPESEIDASEVDTKLELAQAYVEMGDKDAALSILDEVQLEGTPAQKEAAAEIAAGLQS